MQVQPLAGVRMKPDPCHSRPNAPRSSPGYARSCSVWGICCHRDRHRCATRASHWGQRIVGGFIVNKFYSVSHDDQSPDQALPGRWATDVVVFLGTGFLAMCLSLVTADLTCPCPAVASLEETIFCGARGCADVVGGFETPLDGSTPAVFAASVAAVGTVGRFAGGDCPV